jgi:hypothetical protein
MRDCTMVVTGAVTVSGAVGPKLSQLASALYAARSLGRRGFASGVAGHTAPLPRAG